MKFGQREKIFTCALLAVSIFFLLYDQLYLTSKKDEGLEQIQQSRQDQNSPSSSLSPTEAELKIIDDYDEAKSALITYALIGLGFALFYAFWISKKPSQ